MVHEPSVMYLQDNASEALPSQRGSRATSPGGYWREIGNNKVIEVSGLSIDHDQAHANQGSFGEWAGSKPSRYRPRTFPYQRYLPYRHPDKQLENLAEITRRLYIAVSAGDFVPGATHWTRELRGWIQLKFNMPREERIKLTKLYFELALAPGMDRNASERFSSMFMTLTKRKHYLKAGEDLYLDWRPFFREFKQMVLPSDASPVVATQGNHVKTSTKTLIKVCAFAQAYFDPRQVPEVFQEVLPYFSLSSPENAFAAVAILNLLLPTGPPSKDAKWQPQYYLPSIFHLWALMNRSKVFDGHMVDLMSRLARDCLLHESSDFGAFGMFTSDQASLTMTAALRLLEIPVSQVTSPYSSVVDGYQSLAALLDRDQRKHPIAHHIARWIVMSLSPESMKAPESMLTKLEGFVQAIETFYHPSNAGHWTRNLSQLVFYLADFFLMRWNRERSGEMAVPKARHLTEEIRRRFVLCLREVTFLGIFAKSGTAINFALSTLQVLAFLEPGLILPGALQRIYPAMRGLVEVHRTTTSIRALFELTWVIARTKGYRCHLTALLGLALPGIDANDLDKTMHTLTFMQAVFYEMPMCELKGLSDDDSDSGPDGMLASGWVSEQIERLEAEGVDTEIDYDKELSDSEEEAILRSSTADFRTFLNSFMDSVFNLLRNLPDASRVKNGSPEESITNALPATFTPMVSSMSPELYDVVLEKVCEFVSSSTVYQARDAMAYLCCSLAKVDPQKALSKLIPILTQNIRTEVEENGAGLSRTFGSDVLPKDKAVVYNITILAMSLVHVGSSLVDFKEELLSIGRFMHERCKGIAATHASNFLHHVLLTLTMTYTVDHSLYDESDLATGVTAAHWASRPDPQRLNIKWHYADEQEVELAIHVFEEFANKEIAKLTALIGDSPPVRRDGSGKDWSDEVSQSLVLFRLLLSGIAPLFDPRHDIGTALEGDVPNGDEISDDETINGAGDDGLDDADFGATEDEDVKPTFRYHTGYHLRPGDAQYKRVHSLRDEIGHLLHKMHDFLTTKQQDDVTVFNSLYSTYKSWFVDVGFERSAHVLDRVSRLLASDIGSFKYSGLRKHYPRPLLVRRAYVYHLQRLRHNASPRHKTDLDLHLLKDLVESCTSTYTEIRRTAQTAVESSMKVLIGARPFIIPPLLEHFDTAIKANDFPRIKGAMYSLLFGSLAKPVGRDWRYTPTLIKAFLNVMDVDKVSVQKIATAATIQTMDMTRQVNRMTLLDQAIVKLIAPSADADVTYADKQIAKRSAVIQKRFDYVKSRRQGLSEELAEVARTSHWRKESRAATLMIGLGISFEDVASDSMIDFVVSRSIDSHPSLRTIYQSALIGIFTYVDVRAIADHKYENYIVDKQKLPGMVKSVPQTDDPNWTSKFLAQFKTADAETFQDQDYPGWLFWGKAIPSFQASRSGAIEYDDLERSKLDRIGASINRGWLAKIFEYLKQEPRDATADRFRLTNTIGLAHAFSLILSGHANASFEDIKSLIGETFGDGSDKHQHRATSEAMAAILNAAVSLPQDQRGTVWEYAFPIVREIFEEGITPENMSYWQSFLDVVLQNKDPRRSWPLVEWLAGFRLDMSSSAAFKESSKITLLQHSIIGIGWHFELDKPVQEDFLSHLDHPYKGVRDVMGQTLAFMHRIHYHESHKDLQSFVDHNLSASSIGQRPYVASADFQKTVRDVFARLEQWRQERPAGQQTASPYTSGSKTVLAWLETALQSFECTQLIPFFPDTFLESLLHMMDVKEDPELQAHAYSVFRHLGNIPFQAEEEGEFVKACIRIGRTASSWHQRLRIMINMQAVYFRHLFLMPEKRQRDLFTAVSAMLEDTQHEVRVGAGATLSGMIRCSPVRLRESLIPSLIAEYTKKLRQNPAPKRGSQSSGDGNKTALVRHAAVLGLGALVQAFPYTSPPPKWVPEVLTTLATKAANDPGMVGKSAKGIVSDFKKTRQDTWHIDMKAFQAEQLEDLEGVLWKSYFA